MHIYIHIIDAYLYTYPSITPRVLFLVNLILTKLPCYTLACTLS